MADNQCPPVSKALLDWLLKVFPDRLPDTTSVDTSVLVGQQQVIRHLKKQSDRQTLNIVE